MKNSELQDLFVEYYPALKSFAVRYVGAAEVAEDLVQDVFLRLCILLNLSNYLVMRVVTM